MRQISVEQSATRPDWDILVEGVRNNNGAAIEELYQRLQPALRGYVLRRIGVSEDVDDFVEDCWAAVLKEIQKNGPPESIDRYLWGIAKHLRRERIAKSILGRRNSEICHDEISDAAPNPEDMVLLHEQTDVACRILERLPALDREILRRFYFDGQTPLQIQTDLDISSGTFRMRKQRAKAFLKTHLVGMLGPTRLHRDVMPVVSAVALRSRNHTGNL